MPDSSQIRAPKVRLLVSSSHQELTAVRNDDEDDDWDDPDAADFGDDDDEEPFVPCPFCRGDILEDTPRCPHCGEYLSAEDHVRSGRPVWVTITTIVCLAIAVWWLWPAVR